ncbi:mitochondrial intermediate peptidase, mitochondrial isoform X5 [Nicotiana tabacum]|uniref:Mitochondrial intermediate peptidase, mitochondrial isoform X5 n=2 Tax=Nicotiana TaxID=4085 RepID=A0A1S4C6S1_TOBAC|nr:PREDICTED: probable mitochondrial intermediate peptidase, mitochondrial isoform X3 [Nicotiana sylvestris]XP_016496624.1 PREDICTED: probable mitochondrial intermediate peptidase, mitochondrial isoform X3 [Nicotiana tabacum]
MHALIRQSAAHVRANSHFIHISTSKAPSIKETGLYGYHHLKTPKGFQRFVDDAIERSEELVNYIAGMPSSPEIIRAMDEISDTVCSVIDSAELCRHTHPDREFVDEASKAGLRINEFLHYLNTNHSIYKAVIKAEKDSSLTHEAQRAARFLRMDLEKGGIHLCPEKLDRANELSIDIIQLCREYNTNIITDPGHVDIFPASKIPKKMHHFVSPIYRNIPGASKESLGSRDSIKEKGFRIATEPSTLQGFLQCLPDAGVRKMAYVQGNSVPHANLEVLDKLIATRHEFAQLMGYKSYAEFSLHSTMAASPEVVLSFLLEMSKVVRPKADQEFEAIRDFKREKSGEPNGELEPWDEAYFTWLMKSATYKLDSSIIASYFPLPQCIEGLKILVESLFGVTFHRVPLAPGESWHPDVLKIVLHHPTEGDLGYLYLDLKSRKGKHPICAHFAIRGGRRVSETKYQLPEYQHFSGTRVVLDFAETPSNLFESYAWDYRVLETFAKHYSTGDVIPKKLVESMVGAKKMFAATELQRQIFYALVDQTLFGEQTSTGRDTMAIVADLKRQHTSWTHVEGTHWHTRFSHLTNYGAGYYSYLYAKCFATTIWQRICQEDPLSLDTGLALRTKFLQHGGAKDPADILNDLVGSGIIRNCSGGIIPDITSLCEEMELMKH